MLLAPVSISKEATGYFNLSKQVAAIPCSGMAAAEFSQDLAESKFQHSLVFQACLLTITALTVCRQTNSAYRDYVLFLLNVAKVRGLEGTSKSKKGKEVRMKKHVWGETGGPKFSSFVCFDPMSTLIDFEMLLCRCLSWVLAALALSTLFSCGLFLIEAGQ